MHVPRLEQDFGKQFALAAREKKDVFPFPVQQGV